MAEPLPLYVQDEPPQHPFEVLLTRIAATITHPDARTILESFVESRKAPAYTRSKKSKSLEPIHRYPLVQGSSIPDKLTRVKQQIVKELFNAIQREDAEAVALLIQHNLVTADTTSETGQTPLLEAISIKNIAIVKELISLGADCNKFGVVSYDSLGKATRTPLMHAATIGSLPIVKLLFGPYSANDALVAPDGQIALRLAAENGHHAIVDYLSRRAGGYLRFKTHNARSIQRIKSALHQIATYIKFFVWDVPKFFVWVIPKHLVVLPVVRSCRWFWTNRVKIGLWCKHQLTELPKRVVRFGKAAWKTAKKASEAVWKAAKRTPGVIWRAIKKTPGVIWRAVKKIPKAIWRAIKKIPKAIWNVIKKVWEDVRGIGKALWELLTVRIPTAILTALEWIWEGISSLARAIGNSFLRFVSFLHAILGAVVTFLRNVTLRDIWNAFCDFLRAVFVTVPKTLWSWIQKFGEASYRIMKTLFGSFGELLWWIAAYLKDVVVYIPQRLGIILLSVGGSFVKAFHEIRVWISPKA